MTKPVAVPNTFAALSGTIALVTLDQNFSNITSQMNDLTTYSNYVADSGIADNYVANFASGITTAGLFAGLRIQFKALAANTGTSTLQVQVNGVSIGLATIKLTDGSNLPANTIAAGAVVDVLYDGTNFQLMNDASGQALIVTDLSVTGNLTVAGTSTFNNTAILAASITSASTKGALAYGTLNFTDTNIFASFQNSVNSYNQIAIQNTNSGTAASSEFVAYNNLGNATANYVTLGINSSGYTGTGALNAAGYGFLSTASTDLAIGSLGNNSIHFVVNSSATDSVTIDTTGNSVFYTNIVSNASGKRFFADFSNATITSRFSFQTSTVNGTTGVYFLPNGTSTAASIQATNAADPTNASKILIATNGSTDVQLVSGINGTGTYLPLSFYNGGSQRMQLSTSGLFLIAGSGTPSAKLHLGTDAISASSWTTSGIGLRIDSATYTYTTAGGSVATLVAHGINTPAFVASAQPTTITNAATLYLASAPGASTNVTITNAYTLYVSSGSSYFGGTVSAQNSGGTQLSLSGNVSVGLSSYASNTASSVIGISLHAAAATYTGLVPPSGPFSYQAAIAIQTPTFAYNLAGTTVANAATFYINSAPTAGANATLTNAYALFVNSGNVYFGGNQTIAGDSTIRSLTINGTTVNSKLIISGGLTSLGFNANGAGINILDQTFNISTGASGQIRTNYFGTPTITASAAGYTATDVSTVYIPSNPTAGANVTFNAASYGLKINVGGAYIGGATTGNASIYNGSGVALNISGVTTSFVNPAATVSSQPYVSIAAPTYSYSNATSVTTASTVAISGQPVASTNATVTYSYGLFVGGGGMYLAPSTLVPSNAYNGAGTLINAPSGSTSFTGAAGTVAVQASVYIGTQTYTYANATTATVAATVYVNAMPTPGANATFTKSYSIYAANGQAFFGGGVATTPPAVPASYINAATYTVLATDTSLVFTTTACSVTLPSAAAFPGRILYFKNVTATAITSISSNVYPLSTAVLGTAILAATAGKFAMLQSDGTNWVTMMAN